MSDSIEVHVDGPKLTPDKFLKAVDAFFKLVQGVAKNIAGDQEPVWTVEVNSGSAVIRTRSQGQYAPATIDSVTRGMRSLNAGLQVTPAGFTKDEVRAARNLASVVDGISVFYVAIKNGQAPEPLSLRIVETADAILAGEKYIAFGSIEGKLDSLVDRDRFECTIFEPIYGRAVTCSFTKAHVEQEAIAAFRKRVLVTGMIRYGKEGYPTSVHADSLRVFPEESELPTLEEIQAIYKGS